MDSTYKSILDEMEITGDKWTDEDFGRDDAAIRGANSSFLPDSSKFEWRRASEIMKEAVLYEGRIEPNDIEQG